MSEGTKKQRAKFGASAPFVLWKYHASTAREFIISEAESA